MCGNTHFTQMPVPVYRYLETVAINESNCRTFRNYDTTLINIADNVAMFVNDAESACDVSGSLYKKGPPCLRVFSMSALDAVQDMDVLVIDYLRHDEAFNSSARFFVKGIYGPSGQGEQSLGFKPDHCRELGCFFRGRSVVVDLCNQIA